MEETDQNPRYEKASIPELYLAFGNLECKGWDMNKICDSREEISNISFPIVALNNQITGPALWIIAGVHGNETAGPTMLARNIDYIAKELSHIPTVILPLCNPQGYLFDQRNLNHPESDYNGIDVGDASHLLLNEQYGCRSIDASCYESECITSYLLREQARRPPLLVLDLQEDIASRKGYVISRGMHGVRDMYAEMIADAMKEHIELGDGEYTANKRFIAHGITGPVEDNSIGEFVASRNIYLGGLVSGINAETVLTITTPAKDTDLEKRVLAQKNALSTAANIMKQE